MTPTSDSGPVKRKIVKKAAGSGSAPVRRSGARKQKPAPEKKEEVTETVDLDVPLDPSALPVGKPVSMPAVPNPEPTPANPLDPAGKEVAPAKPPREVLGEPTFKFFCYRCGQKLMVPVSWANKSYPCGRCHHEIVIPPPLIGNIW